MIKESQIEVFCQKTNFKFAGKGEKLVILHGWGGSSESWKEVIKYLKDSFEIFCPDIPGFGKSEPPKKVWTISDFALWLKDFCEKLNLKEFFLLGHSFGGRIAVKFSVLFPEKVKKLILCDSAGIKREKTISQKILFFSALFFNAIFSKKPLKRLGDKLRNLFYIFLRNSDWPKAKGTLRQTLKNVLEEDLRPEISKIKVKTLILWGKNDKICPLKDAYFFHQKIKDSVLKIIPKAAHSPHLETPKDLAKEVLNFLKNGN